MVCKRERTSCEEAVFGEDGDGVDEEDRSEAKRTPEAKSPEVWSFWGSASSARVQMQMQMQMRRDAGGRSLLLWNMERRRLAAECDTLCSLLFLPREPRTYYGLVFMNACAGHHIFYTTCTCTLHILHQERLQKKNNKGRRHDHASTTRGPHVPSNVIPQASGTECRDIHTAIYKT